MTEYYVIHECTSCGVVGISAILPLGIKYVELKEYICIKHKFLLKHEILNTQDHAEELRELFMNHKVDNI